METILRARTPSPLSNNPNVQEVDSTFLRGLLGYNTRRASLRSLELFATRTAAWGLKPVEFSVLNLVGRNPNVSPGQLCIELALLAPNLTKILQRLIDLNLIEKVQSSVDKRVAHLHLTPFGRIQLTELESVVTELERDTANNLTDMELKKLIKLLQKIY